jgi:translocator protein
VAAQWSVVTSVTDPNEAGQNGNRTKVTMRKPPALLLTSTAVALTAAAGAVGTDVRSRWYRRLDKPSWQPPGAVFGPVWSALYVLLAGAGARALERAEQGDDAVRRRYLTAYAANLVLNTAWSWIFFRGHKPALALAEILVLEASTVDLVRRSWQLDRAAGVALVPYAAWVSFATALTAELARRNA